MGSKDDEIGNLVKADELKIGWRLKETFMPNTPLSVEDIERIWKRNKDEAEWIAGKAVVDDTDKELIEDANEHMRLCIAYAEMMRDAATTVGQTKKWQSALSRMKGE